MSDKAKTRIAVLLTHPAPYREPVLEALFGDRQFEFFRFSIFKRDFGHEGMSLGEDSNAIAAEVATLHPGIVKGIGIVWRLCFGFSLSRKYDIVIWPAYAPWWLTVSVFVRKLLRRKYALSLDTVHETGGWIARKIKASLFSGASFFWVPGAASKEYLVDFYGVCPDRIVKGLYLPNPPIEKDDTEGRGFITFLMIANNRPFRRVNAVVEGFRRFASSRMDCRLLLCGEGMSVFAGDNVMTLEGVANHDIGKLYSQADVYVHNGDEQFSTALLMGAMVGKPLLTGSAVGVVADLFGSGDPLVGIKVDNWETPNVWADAFDRMYAMKDSWKGMGRIAKEKAGMFVPEKVAGKIIEQISK